MTREQRLAVQRIADATPDGVMQAKLFVEEARDPASPLHNLLNWNDAEAAEQHRLDQARRIIRHIKTIVTSEEVSYREIVYVRNPTAQAREPGYVAIADIALNPAKARAALDLEIARVGASIQRGWKIARELGLEDEYAEALVALAESS